MDKKRYKAARWNYRLKLLAVFYLLSCIVLALFESDLLYVPYRGPNEPLKAGLGGYERQVFTAADGAEIPYWRTSTRQGPTILYFHGNGGGLHAFVPTLERFAAEGLNIIAMEYRGYPGAPGAPSQRAIVADALTLLDSQQQPVIVWGYSLGSGVAMQVAARRNIRAVVLEAPFLSAADRAGEMFPLFPTKLLMRDQYRSDHAIAHIEAPIYIMHGGQDRIVPDAHGRELAALAPEKTRFHFYPKADHFTLAENGAYADVFAWLKAPN